jgi:hypothetical protein
MISNIRNVCKADLILFCVQVSLIFMVTSVSLLNLTYEWGNQNLWTVVLTSSLGYIMPNPKIKFFTEKTEDSLNNIELNETNDA